MDFAAILSRECKLAPRHTEAIIALLDEGNTLPFIARYRKERTGGADDQTLRAFCERLSYLKSLEARKEDVLRLIEEAGGLTPELRAAVDGASTLTEVEDLYRPFKKKRATRASKARERGLAPLAEEILEGRDLAPARYLSDQVKTEEEALAGALDIIAEQVGDDPALRRTLRADSLRHGQLSSTARGESDSVYRTYYGYREPVSKIPSHRILALGRGEREGFLRVQLEVDEARQRGLCSALAQNRRHAALIRRACDDAYTRLIFPAIEREVRAALTDRANEAGIRAFAENLRALLMQPPLRGAVIMGLDPGFRTGCKVAVISPTSKVLDTGVIYPTHSERKKEEARSTLRALIARHGVTVIAIGNGTASRETEQFVADLLHDCPGVSYLIVSEAGASVYSASKLAAEEFPQFDLTLRSAVSIARRLADPLAELVKIPPEAIGVGQYQHDMPKARLSEALAGVVEDCVNSVGVDLNTASVPLLSQVAGIGPTVAKNIVAYREEHGPFRRRAELLNVPKLGPRAYTQCAGFLRIPDGDDPLDNTSVHPESYKTALALLARFGRSPSELRQGVELPIEGLAALAEELGVGLPTLTDILSELRRPGRDPRDSLPGPILRSDVLTLDDLTPGMELSGTVRNVVDFGAFIDIGLHEDGLCHISELSDRFVKHPSEVVRTGDIVRVRVLAVEKEKKRISLSMRSPRTGPN